MIPQLQSQLRSLQALHGRHTGFISLYIPASRKMSDILAYLRNEVTQTQNIQDKVNRKNVLSGITRMIE